MEAIALENFTLEEARARWQDETAELPIGPKTFLALCAAHGVRVSPKQREALQTYVSYLYACGNRSGARYRQDVQLPARMPDISTLGPRLSDALDGIVNESKLRLSVNMVPKPLFRKNLRKYLSRSKWNELRQGLIAERGCRCELCGAAIEKQGDVDAHEEWEYAPSKRPARATVTGIKLACPDCHAVVHFGLQLGLVEAGKLPITHLDHLQEHFCAVNKVGPKMFSIHLHGAMQRWTELNRKKAWQLDFGPYRPLLAEHV